MHKLSLTKLARVHASALFRHDIPAANQSSTMQTVSSKNSVLPKFGICALTWINSPDVAAVDLLGEVQA